MSIFANCTQHFSISIIPCCYLTKMFLFKNVFMTSMITKSLFFFQYKHHLPSPWPLMSCEVFLQNASNTSSSFLNALRYFDSVQKWPFYKHAYNDKSIYCGGYLKETQNFFGKIFSWIPKNWFFIIKKVLPNCKNV